MVKKTTGDEKMNEDIEKIVKMIEGFQHSISQEQEEFSNECKACQGYNAQLTILEILRLNVLLIDMGYKAPTKHLEKKEKK